MAEMPAFDDATYAMLVQVLMAFSHGAGPVLVSSDAILALTADYRDRAHEHRNQWSEEAPTVLAWARALGAIAAHSALDAGRALLDKRDYERAKDAVSRHSEELMIGCPWCRASATA